MVFMSMTGMAVLMGFCCSHVDVFASPMNVQYLLS